jgi:hypothetical protein
MRYFLISISTASTSETLTFESTYFPKKYEIIKAIGTDQISINNIFEFASKEDYESFTSKS